MPEISGKTVLITGAGRGIGEAAARAFVARGAKVGLIGRDGTRMAGLAAELGAGALPLACDVADFAQVETAVARMLGTFGRLDVLINNAGVIEPIAPLSAVDPAAWSRSIDINLKGVFHGMRAAMPVMAAQGGGRIITVSSGAAHAPLEGWSAYCAGKAGAAMLTAACDLEGQAIGVRAMGISPGTVATDMQKTIRASGINRVSQLDPSAHIPPEWPAQALLWMCTADADAFLGQEISLRDEAMRRRIGVVK